MLSCFQLFSSVWHLFTQLTENNSTITVFFYSFTTLIKDFNRQNNLLRLCYWICLLIMIPVCVHMWGSNPPVDWQCQRSSSASRCTLERRATARSRWRCTEAVTSHTNPLFDATPVRAPRRSPPTSMSGPTRTHPSSRSYQVLQGSHSSTKHVFSLMLAPL